MLDFLIKSSYNIHVSNKHIEITYQNISKSWRTNIMANEFKETRNLFINSTGYTIPLSYEEWMAVPSGHKAAVLFVQFYDQITLAWYKTKSFFVLEEDGVSTMLQYLMKNVPIIEKDPKRFKPSYIYKVAYNCLYCISHNIKRDIERFENEVSNIVSCGEDQLDLFDTIVSNSDVYDEISREEFWATIENMGLKTQKVINYLLNGESLNKLGSRTKTYEGDPLRDIAVSVDEMEAILAELRVKLAKYRTF